MAEFDHLPPNDADEAAYREALLGDEAGREARRARLMAALPVAEPVVPVSRAALAWRWQPVALGLLATGLLLAAVLASRGRPSEPPPRTDPRPVAGQAASEAAVVARADPVVLPPTAIAEATRAATKAAPHVSKPVVVADAAAPQPMQEQEAAAVEPASPPKPSPASPPAAAPVVAAAPARAQAEAVPSAAASQAEVWARMDRPALGSSLRGRATVQTLSSEAASGAAPASQGASSFLLAAAGRADAVAARHALRAGASVHQHDAQGRTALMLAARAGSRELVDLLLAAGARREDRDQQGWTAADHAQAQGHVDLVEPLR